MTVKRMTFLQELLSFVGLGGRLHLDWISSAEAQKFVRVVTEFTAKIKGLGPSPLSGRIDLAAMISSVEALPVAASVEEG
jgi:F420-non-reducing hydrogenase iron-sulfur subunit